MRKLLRVGDESILLENKYRLRTLWKLKNDDFIKILFNNEFTNSMNEKLSNLEIFGSLVRKVFDKASQEVLELKTAFLNI